MGAKTLIGRERFVPDMLHDLSEGKNLLLIGPEGVGKTAILKRLMEVSSNMCDAPRFIYCGQTNTLKIILQQVATTLLLDFHDLPLAGLAWSNVQDFTLIGLKRMLRESTLLVLKQAVVQSLRNHKYALILDHLCLLRHPVSAFLEFLIMQCKVPLIGATRDLHYKRIGRLNRLLWAFTKLHVENLEHKAARILIDRCLEQHRREIPDRPGFTAELLRLSRGNPKVITQVCAMAGDRKYQLSSHIDVKLILLDLKMQAFCEGLSGEKNGKLTGQRSSRSAI